LDIFVAAAAVADYRPARVSAHKLKRKSGPSPLELEPTPDVLAAVAAADPRPFTVGFAAETRDLEDNARDKLRDKGVDLLAANPVAATGPGLESDDNRLLLLWPGGRRELGLGPKARLARELADCIVERYEEGRA
jgi:phosphopantothenoylcysteine decarboxylase/phosphopantothenate--cysteine ligase